MEVEQNRDDAEQRQSIGQDANEAISQHLV
jgi:hypothetical protein